MGGRMKTREVFQFFGNGAQTAKQLGISHAAVYQWGERPPIMRQYHIEAVTRGRLKAEPNQDLER